MHRIWAAFAGYFWLPCPECGRMFGGHEWKDYDGPRVVRLDGTGTAHGGKMLCPTCTPIVAQREFDDFLRRGATP